MRHISRLLPVLCLMLAIMLAPGAAEAAYQPLTCGPNGTVAGGQLYYADQTNHAGYCQYQGLNHIFSYVICQFLSILDDMMGKVYCGMQFAITGMLYLAFTLYIIVFGVQMLMGLAQLNAKEVLTRFLKIGAIWGFATQSAWGIGIAFTFFVSFIDSAGTWVVNGVLAATPPAAWAPLSVIQATPIAPGATSQAVPLFVFLDDLVFSALTGPFAAVQNKVVGFFFAMIAIFTPLWMLGAWWLTTTLMTLMRTVMTFLLSLAAIAFLITLSPIFFSFILFQSTQHLFENWLRYIASYAVQTIIVFAVIMFWILLLIKFMDFYNQLSNVIFPYKNTALVLGPDYNREDTWGICPGNYGTDALGQPTAACQDSGFHTLNQDESINVADMRLLILPTNIITHTEFIYFLCYHLISLLLVTFAFSEIIKKAPEIARSLSGAGNIPLLVLGGWGNSGFGSAGGHLTPAMLKPSNITNQMSKAIEQLAGRRSNPAGGPGRP